MIGLNNTCMGCGAKEFDPECDCVWATCKCGAWDCWVDDNGHYSCKHCGYCSDSKAYDW